jgi:hypothetical protein
MTYPGGTGFNIIYYWTNRQEVWPVPFPTLAFIIPVLTDDSTGIQPTRSGEYTVASSSDPEKKYRAGFLRRFFSICIVPYSGCMTFGSLRLRSCTVPSE